MKKLIMLLFIPLVSLGQSINIPDEVVAIHGISNEKVQNSPIFKDLAKEIPLLIRDSDLGGFNSNRFDIPLLAEEMIRADIDDREFANPNYRQKTSYLLLYVNSSQFIFKLSPKLHIFIPFQVIIPLLKLKFGLSYIKIQNTNQKSIRFQ